MVSCAFCELKDIKETIIIETENVFVAPNPFPTLPNELIIVPKSHYTIFEQLPEKTLFEIAILTKYISAALFDTISSKGTNIVIQNGSSSGQIIAHTSVRIIPRTTISELDTGWDSINLTNEELQIIAAKLRNALSKLNDSKNISTTTPVSTNTPENNNINAVVTERSPSTKIPETIQEQKNKRWEDNDYMKRQLFRNP
jgi:diadenosine tetraphosphate (Ap4A) HIT family hydrolase